MSQKPIIAIVGRPNVGKSAVFNRLAGRRISIVHDQPGVTRDRITAECNRLKWPVTLIDTGGIGAAIDDELMAQVDAEVDIALEASDVILLVVDGKDGMTPVDQAVAQRLRRKHHPVVLAVNKVDTDQHVDMTSDFARLGFDAITATSAAHGRGFPELNELLEDAILQVFPDLPSNAPKDESDEDGDEAPQETSAPPTQIAIVGRPNVGKSSLINAILEDQRTIVSDMMGTTRDAIDVPYERNGKPFVLIDTAGIRKRTKRDTVVEVFSVMRAERSVRRADLCALVIDASTGVREQDRKIGQLIVEENKPCVIVVNKFDLYHPTASFKDRWEQLQEELRRDLFFLHYAPLVAVSAKEGYYLKKVFAAIERVRDASKAGLSTGALNRLLQRAMEQNPPPAEKRRRLNVFYATLAREHRQKQIMAPDIVLFLNDRNLLRESYQRYLENQIRKECAYEGLPIRFDVRERRRSEKKKKK
ncbi:MAG: ribosome biogenesis GTPase Der [Verrucomicrobiae bacterium]|nr:ribosome biogenesis GTPase Der [Verrucomicrobiae bacterium]